MDLYARYAEFIEGFLKIEQSLTVVFDCSNGTTGLVLRKVKSKREKVKGIFINDRPDGNFLAHGPDPLRPDALRDLIRAVQENKADCGVIFDADGDRVFFVDDKGKPLTADNAAILIGETEQGPVALDVRMGYGAREWFASHNRAVVDSRVGHYFIKKLMREKNISYAAELSGHYYFSDFFYCDSGIFAAIRFLNSVARLKQKGMKLSEWITAQPHYYQSREINFEVTDKEAMMKKVYDTYKDEARITSTLDGIKMEFGEGDKAWWFNVRPSNTENLLRLNLEAKDKKLFNAKLKEIKALIQG